MGIKPKLRPKDEEFKKIVAAANSGGGDDAPAAKGGKGGGKSVNPLAKEGSADYKKMQKANTDNSYGYYDVNTGDYVPWYIDIQNGGGMNTAGPTFEGGFGTAGLIGGLLNAAGVSPYGQDRPRAFMPMEAYRGGKDKPAPFDYRGGGSAAPAPTGVIDAAVSTPDPIKVPTSTIIPILNANQDAYEQAAFPPSTSSDRPLTGTADMPPGLLPINTIRSAYEDLYDRYPEGDVSTPDYVAQKKLLEYARFGEGRPLSTSELASLMPSQLPQSPDTSSPANAAMTTPGMDFLMNMAQNTVMTKYPTMPAQEQRLRIDQEYQKLAQMLGY